MPERPTVPGSPATLDHAGIAARVPHAGRMCLLASLVQWNAEEIACTVTNHSDPEHPLRDRAGGIDFGLPAPVAIEYAAQATALHASLNVAKSAEGAEGAIGAEPTPGFLASARDVRLHAARLDPAVGPLRVSARRLAGDERQAMYRFALHDAPGTLLVEGRLTVVLSPPLPLPLPSPLPPAAPGATR